MIASRPLHAEKARSTKEVLRCSVARICTPRRSGSGLHAKYRIWARTSVQSEGRLVECLHCEKPSNVRWMCLRGLSMVEIQQVVGRVERISKQAADRSPHDCNMTTSSRTLLIHIIAQQSGNWRFGPFQRVRIGRSCNLKLTASRHDILRKANALWYLARPSVQLSGW